MTGDATLKASHGSVQIGEAGGDLDAKLSYGDLDIATALASVDGEDRLRHHRARRDLERLRPASRAATARSPSACAPGVPAWLDLSSKNGRVRNELDGDRAPEASEQTVAVRARTQFGDITIHRATKGSKK